MGLFRNWKTHHEQQKLNKATKLFMDGKVDKAKSLLQTFEYKRSGDAAAILALTAAASDTLDHARQTYHDLWEAKNSCLINADLAAAVDTALDAVAPLVLESAEEDIRKIHAHFTDGDKAALFAACEEHVAYGHPDAVALQIAGYLRFGVEGDALAETYHYSYYLKDLHSSWFYNLSRMARKGFSPAIAPLAEQTLEKLRLLGGDGIISDPVSSPAWDEPISDFDWQ